MPLRRGYERAGVRGLVLVDFEPAPGTSFTRREIRRAYVEAHGFELLFGILAALSALSGLLDPSSLAKSAVGEALHPFDLAWNAAYLVGALGIIFGLLRPSPRVEAAALIVLSGAVLANAVAVVALRGVSGATSVATFATAGVIFLVRARLIYTGVQDFSAAAVESRKRRSEGTEQRRNA